MGEIKVTSFDIEGLHVIEPKVFGDERGYFVETYNQNDYEKQGLCMKFVQDNQSYSKKGVLRGLHFQKHFPQGKLVRVISGEVFDVAVDIREGSKTYGKWHGEVLSGENKKSFYIPEGFAHGYYVMSEEAIFSYKCTDFYHPNDEGGLPWNDETIGVKWPIEPGTQVVLSDKDTKYKPFQKKILITGASGQLGRAVYEELSKRNDCKVYRSARGEHEGFLSLNVTQKEDVLRIVKENKIDIIINCAAMTAVDLCETEKEQAYEGNVVTARNVAKVAAQTGAVLFHISTDYVFDGTKETGYEESDKTGPISEYGRTKLLAEEEVQKNCKEAYILRTSWLYGDGHNFVRTMLKLAESKDEICVVSDQIGCPTSCVEVAKVIAFLINRDDYGIYHVCCEGNTSWYEFAKEIFALWKKNVKTIPITSAEYKAPAKRPAYSILKNTKLEQLGYHTSTWQDALKVYHETEIAKSSR